MPDPRSLIADTVEDADWLAHRYEAERDAIHFVHAPRTLRNSVPFLTDAEMKISGDPRVLTRADALGANHASSPIHYILHSAYCCSTLAAKALDIPGVSHSLKEPQILNDMVGWRHRGGDPSGVARALDAALTLLARPFRPGEATIIKPSNVVNGLATAMMGMRPKANCLILYAPLPGFLASIARKGMWGRLWVRELMTKQLVDGLIGFGFEVRDHLLHTDLQAAAVGWLAQQKLFAEMATKWPDRIRTLNSETFVARPGESVEAIAELFGLALEPDRISGIVNDVFGRNAKDDTPFAANQRTAERTAGEELHRDEIDKVAIWAEAVARSASVVQDLPAPLLPA